MDSKGKPAVERDAIGGERRQHRRYHLEMELTWKLIRRRRVLDTGIGHTIDLSGSGILFNAGRPLPGGHNVELSISWPVLLNDAVPLRLIAKGRIVRDNGGQVVIQTMERQLLAMPKTHSRPIGQGEDTKAQAGGAVPPVLSLALVRPRY